MEVLIPGINTLFMVSACIFVVWKGLRPTMFLDIYTVVLFRNSFVARDTFNLPVYFLCVRNMVSVGMEREINTSRLPQAGNWPRCEIRGKHPLHHVHMYRESFWPIVYSRVRHCSITSFF